MPTSNAGLRRDGDALVFTGALLRDDVAGLWRQASATLDSVRRFDLQAVTRIDSAGLALLAELAARAGGGITVDGTPAGLAELRAAYRLDPALGFAA
ncbi:STAS domain-containing protein [Luteimonas sp. 22616]|uniref:STAS domain-containing protein n=1 Tax=Luteimonas sp. 22616 TaxID=3453951 RepID=UPI003F866A06